MKYSDKCKFGYAELDFVGKVISEEGPQMSSTRKQSALDFPIPVYAKHLKSFLGTVNYFRDFIRNQSSLVHLLHAIIADYDKTRKIQWTTEALKAYKDIKLQVSKCTIMYFMSDTAPITLHTDSLDYGVGGYLFQMVDGVNQPIAFVSKSSTSAQLRWSVMRKEAYGIYYSCMYLES